MRAPAPHDEAPRRVSFPPLTWAVLAVFALLLLGALGGQLLIIEQQRDITRQQRELAERQLKDLSPLVESARPLVDSARPLVDSALPLVKAARPLVEDLDRADLPRTSQAVGRFAEQLLRADPLRTLQSVATMSDTVNANGRLERLMRSSITVLGNVRESRLVDRAVQASRTVERLDRTQELALGLLRQTVFLQREALAINKANLTTARQTLETAQRTEGHAASLDRKFGGQIPVTGR